MGASLPEEPAAFRMALEADGVLAGSWLWGVCPKRNDGGTVGVIFQVPASWTVASFAPMLLQIGASHCSEQNLPVQGGFHFLLLIGMAVQASLNPHVGGILDGWRGNSFATSVVQRALP